MRRLPSSPSIVVFRQQHGVIRMFLSSLAASSVLLLLLVVALSELGSSSAIAVSRPRFRRDRLLPAPPGALTARRHDGRSVVHRPERKDQPCTEFSCFRPRHHFMSRHDSWVPKHLGFEDSPEMQRDFPANLHNGGTGKTLPWVVNRTQPGNNDPEYEEKHWWRLRPHGDVVGPEVLSCTSVEPFKFYLMEEALLPDCPGKFSSGKNLLDQIPPGGRQYISELFFYWQLRNHTWRTYDPMEAQLVVVPFFAGLLARDACGPIQKGIDHVVDALEAFPRYHLNQGKDFLM